MLPKQMDGAKKFGMNLIRNTDIVKDARDVVTFKQRQNLVLKKTIRFRSAFTTEQVNYLEKEFKKFPYVETLKRKEISNRINISDRAVKIWFQNRRMKEKKDNGTNYQYGIINKQTQINDNNDVNNETNENLTKEKKLLSSQNNSQHFGGAKIKKIETNNKCDTSGKKRDFSTERIIKISPRMRNNTIIPPTSSTSQENICSNDNVRTTSKYFDNTNKDHLSFQHIRRKLYRSHDMTSKQRLTKKSMSSNQHYVSVNSNSEQKYIPMYNYCTSSLPIGAPVTAGVSLSTGSSVSRGNVIWEQINMLPPSTMAPVRTNTSSETPLVNQNTTRSCNCNCHELFQSHSTITGFNRDLRIQPQYLLAIPLNNACNQI